MSEAVVDDIVAVLPPLLQSLEALSFVARHLNPPDFGRVMEAAGTPDEALRSARARLGEWPAEFADVRTPIEAASDAALAAFAGLREVQHGNGDLIAVFRALRYAPARAGSALSAGREISAGQRLLCRSRAARRHCAQGAAGPAGSPGYRHLP